MYKFSFVVGFLLLLSLLLLLTLSYHPRRHYPRRHFPLPPPPALVTSYVDVASPSSSF